MGVSLKEALEFSILFISRLRHLAKLQLFVLGCAWVCLLLKFIFHYADEKRCSPRPGLISV